MRCVPLFTHTLISIDQLWQNSKADTRFADQRKVTVRHSKGKSFNTIFPLVRTDRGLHIWRAVTRQDGSKDNLALAASADNNEPLETPGVPLDISAFHRPATTSHFDAISGAQAAALLHHRLHLSPSTLSQLADRVSDLPDNLKHARSSSCEHCVKANATKLDPQNYRRISTITCGSSPTC